MQIKSQKLKSQKLPCQPTLAFFAVPEPMLEHSQFHGPCNWCHLCLALFPQITYMAWSLLLRTECLCPSKIRCWSLFLNVMVLECGALWGYLSHEGRVLMNGISEWDQCPYKKKRESCFFFSLSTMWTQQEGVCKPGRGSSQRTQWPAHYCFSHPNHGILR